MAELLKSGELAPKSGHYEIVGPRGGKQQGQAVTSNKGEPLPPTPKPNQRFQYVTASGSKSAKSGRQK